MKLLKLTILLTICIFSFTYGENSFKVDSTKFETAEGIGEYLSMLLIKRGEIGKTQVAISIDEMLPDEDLSEFEDSPTELILSIFKGYEVLLPQSWDRLLKNADSLNLFDDTNYIGTFFFQTHREKYKSVAVLEKGKNLYALNYEVLIWEHNSNFVIAVDDKLKIFNDMNELIKDYSTNLFKIDDNVSPPIKENIKYNYGNFEVKKIKSVSIPSFENFIDKVEYSIENMKSYENFIGSQIDKQIKEELKKNWKELTLFIEKNGLSNLRCYSTTMTNISGEKLGEYSVILGFEFNTDSKVYTFSCIASLNNDKWYLVNLYPFEEETKSEFKF